MKLFSVFVLALFLSGQGCAKPDSPKLKITEYFSPQCESCVAMEPVLNEILSEFKGAVILEKINLDTVEGASAGRALGIKEIPVLIFTDREGREYFRHEGKLAPEIMRAIIKDRIQ